jgi:hypothetical protein
MTRDQVIDAIARAIAEMEGFFARRERPTLAQRNANPGNIRRWKDAAGRSYPVASGYVDFMQWASDRFPGASREEISRRALDEGWRVLRVLVGQYVDGKYTGGQPPTLDEIFKRYAPAADSNDPVRYARFVADRLGVRPDQKPRDLIQEG